MQNWRENMQLLNKEQIQNIVLSTIGAGKIAKKYFCTDDFVIQKKSDNSKVTSADIEVSKFLEEKLSKILAVPVVCEENKMRDFSEEIFWLVDPIDGTNSFIAGNVEFAINIALVKNQQPIFGMIYAPLFENGKMIFNNEKNKIILLDDEKKEKIITKKDQDNSTLRIITSPRTKDSDIIYFVENQYPNLKQNYRVERLSSAIKFFRLIEGEADVYLHLRPSMEWDIASGHALLKIMGGKVKKLLFNPKNIEVEEELIYKKSDFFNQAFIADL